MDPNKNVQATTSREGLLQETQQQVNELIEILSDNVDRALEREHNLTELNEIGENLQRHARDFRTMTSALKPQNIDKPSKSPPRENVLQETQQQVDELVDILFVNVHRALEREHNLLVLNEIGENLERGACDFLDMAATLKRNMWKKRLKTVLVLIGGIGAIFLAIFLLI
ncbi:vesicle-associated membrane protein 3-like [Lucilia sericata]|uniref:vesicle-associated membrane protein 3-like n=1 Tax=Lucilia sericata TaxID=13632 RepID=UPI0018A850D4|nr:vesicle-associated membrane protein 3-like [Lucilia sericata]